MLGVCIGRGTSRVGSCYARCEWFLFLPSVYLNTVTNYARKPRNARSKRALEAREPKEIEDARTAIFVRGTHTGEVVHNAMKELVCDPALGSWTWCTHMSFA